MGFTGPTLACTFCGKSQGDVAKLIAGPNVFICNECVGLCNQIITEHERDARDERLAKRQDAEQDAVVELMDDQGLANLLAEQLDAHGELDLTLRAAVRAAVERLGRK
jgi:ATP-dependent protease Clp ATPase subunit